VPIPELCRECYQQCKNDPLQQLKSDPVNLTQVLFGKHHDFKRRVHENRRLKKMYAEERLKSEVIQEGQWQKSGKGF